MSETNFINPFPQSITELFPAEKPEEENTAQPDILACDKLGLANISGKYAELAVSLDEDSRADFWRIAKELFPHIAEQININGNHLTVLQENALTNCCVVVMEFSNNIAGATIGTTDKLSEVKSFFFANLG